MTLREIVQESDTKPGRTFDFAVLFLIVLSIITMTVETLPDLPPMARSVLSASEVVITVLFTIEYGLRIATSARKNDAVCRVSTVFLTYRGILVAEEGLEPPTRGL